MRGRRSGFFRSDGFRGCLTKQAVHRFGERLSVTEFFLCRQNHQAQFRHRTSLRLQVHRLSEGGIEATFEEDLAGERLPEVVETALFRVAQEALTNARKHSGAERVRVSLGRSGGALRLEVRDWGRGFAADADGAKGEGDPGERVGLSSMRERVALLGGRLEVTSEPGAGTAVVAEVPLEEKGATGGGQG